MRTRLDLANAVRALAMDAVQQANSGHPGMPMGMADIAEVLWNDFYKHNPSDPTWVDRDRFVLSNGHGSMLQYALLHLSGYNLPLEELKHFRQLHSKTPGHPEVFETPGVETTTGPLGQGLANAVGFALAEKVLGKRFNRAGHSIVDHKTWVLLGDGCLMEGISHEACSLAGTLGLNKLIALYDDNGISIDGKVGGWFTDDTPMRFRSYGWNVIEAVDGHDSAAIKAAIAQSTQSDKPTLICLKTIIGFGSPNKAGTEGSHGAPLGDDEISGARAAMGWNHPPFEMPEGIKAAWERAGARGGGTFRPGIVVGDQRDVHVADLQFTSQIALRILGHVDDFPTLRSEPLRLSARREPRALDDHHGPLGVGGDSQLPGFSHRHFPHHRTVRIRRRDMCRDRPVVESVLATRSPVHELIADHEVAGHDTGLKRAAGVRPDYS